MNNRQKAKHFKILYENLRELNNPRSQPFPLRITRTQPVKLRVKQTIHESAFTGMYETVETPVSLAVKCCGNSLAKELINYCKMEIVPSLIPEHVDIVAEVEVLPPESDSHCIKVNLNNC